MFVAIPVTLSPFYLFNLQSIYQMKKQAITRLKKTLLTKTGLDFENYRNPEVMETIADIIIFPIYAAKSVLLPFVILLLTLIGSCILFTVLDKSYFGIFLFFLVGLISCIFNGIPLGAINFVRQLTGDIGNIIGLSLEQSQRIVQDIEEVHRKAKDKEFEYPKISEVIAGVIYIVILPTVTEIISKRIPKVGKMVSWVISKVMNAIAEKMIGISDHSERLQEKAAQADAEENAEGAVVSAEEQTGKSYYTKSINVLGKIKEKTDRITGGIIKVVSSPFVFLWVLVLIVTGLVMYPISLLL